MLNFLSSLSSFVGFFIGVAISTNSDAANGWILSIAAGLFIYIALVDLVSTVEQASYYLFVRFLGNKDSTRHSQVM